VGVRLAEIANEEVHNLLGSPSQKYQGYVVESPAEGPTITNSPFVLISGVH